MSRHIHAHRQHGRMALDCDRIWTDVRLVAQADCVVGCRDGRIVYAGPRAGEPGLSGPATDCGGALATPGLIDCHTHLVYAGSRADEFEARLAGASYAEIARAGGGIASTVRATRAASQEALFAASKPRLDAMVAQGVTTVEIKSGYGLTLDDEAKMLRVARALADACDVGVATTFLGAHAVPPEFAGDADGYVEHLCNDMLPALAAEGLVDAVDAFCEGIAFSPDQVARVFTTARALGLPVKLHAEQLSNQRGAVMAAGFGALSVDHLEYLDEAGISAVADAGSVAVLLPGAYYFTHETQLPPVDALRMAGVPMAVATDCNPGTSPLTSPLTAMNMAATLFRLTVDECLAGMTVNPARALGRAASVGTLEAGKACDMCIWDAERPADLVYPITGNPLRQRIRGGR